MRVRMEPFILCASIAAIGAGILVAQNVPDFGLSEARLKPQLARAVVDGYVPMYPNGKLYHAATPAAQAAFVKNTLSWMKAYTESSAFQADYDKQRAAAKPSPPKATGTADEEYTKQLAEQRQSLEDMKKNVAKMSPDMQKQMQPVIQQMEANLEKTANDPQMSAMMKQGYAQQAESDKEAYAKELQDYASRFPADPKSLIANRLRHFIEVSKDVAFDAKLVPGSGGKMKFADPQYEGKSNEWKLCYRAGKGPVETARAFAVDWLRQIEKK